MTVPRLALFVPWATVAIYAGLTGMGFWSDEFFQFAGLRDGGWPTVAQRLINWSPRPLSELVLAFYARACAAWQAPLIAPFLLLVWTLVIGCAFVPARRGTAGSTVRLRDQALVAGGLLAVFLTGAPVSEVFYWPAGAAAYLPTLAGATLLFVQLLHGRDGSRSGRAVCCGALMLASTSSEIGAVFAILFAGCEAIPLLTQRSKRDSSHVGAAWRATWFIVPGLVAAILLATLSTHRLQVVERPIALASGGLDIRSALVTASMRAWDEFSGGGSGGALPMIAALCVAAGIALGWGAGSSGTRLVANAVALLGTAAVSLVAASAHFGAICCERHQTMRYCFVVLLLASLFATIGRGRRHEVTTLRRGMPALLITAACLIGVAGKARDLVREYRLYPSVLHARAVTWRSGLEPGSAAMEFIAKPAGPLIRSKGLPPGMSSILDQPATPRQWPLMYFRKSTIYLH